MEVIPRSVDFFLVGRQDVANDQLIELTIAEMIGELEHDLLVEQRLDGCPQQLVQVIVIEMALGRQNQFRFKPLRDRQSGRAFPS